MELIISERTGCIYLVPVTKEMMDGISVVQVNWVNLF
jgi:hypothetical protein